NRDYASWDLGQIHMGRSGQGVGNRDYASWDLGQMHMGRSGQGDGEVHRRGCGEERDFGGKNS
nr:hypothetical protein [Tanacetum cinerariifolium]